MSLYVVEHPSEKGGNILVQIDEDNAGELVRFGDLRRYGIVVRWATKAEEERVEGMEQEMEAGEPDLYRHWPEEEAEIILQIKDW